MIMVKQLFSTRYSPARLPAARAGERQITSAVFGQSNTIKDVNKIETIEDRGDIRYGAIIDEWSVKIIFN